MSELEPERLRTHTHTHTHARTHTHTQTTTDTQDKNGRRRRYNVPDADAPGAIGPIPRSRSDFPRRHNKHFKAIGARHGRKPARQHLATASIGDTPDISMMPKGTHLLNYAFSTTHDACMPKFDAATSDYMLLSK